MNTTQIYDLDTLQLAINDLLALIEKAKQAKKRHADSPLLVEQHQELYERYINELFELLQQHYNLNIHLPFAL